MDLVKEGSTLTLRNAKIDMFKGSMRLAVDRWGRVEVAEPASFTVKEDNNLSLIEYELVNVEEWLFWTEFSCVPVSTQKNKNKIEEVLLLYGASNLQNVLESSTFRKKKSWSQYYLSLLLTLQPILMELWLDGQIDGDGCKFMKMRELAFSVYYLLVFGKYIWDSCYEICLILFLTQYEFPTLFLPF